MDELARQQRMIWIADGRACSDGSGVSIDRVVEERQRTVELLLRVARHLNVHRDRPLQPGFGNGSQLRLARVEGCVDRIELDERIELRAGSADQRPLVYQALT